MATDSLEAREAAVKDAAVAVMQAVQEWGVAHSAHLKAFLLSEGSHTGRNQPEISAKFATSIPTLREKLAALADESAAQVLQAAGAISIEDASTANETLRGRWADITEAARIQFGDLFTFVGYAGNALAQRTGQHNSAAAWEFYNPETGNIRERRIGMDSESARALYDADQALWKAQSEVERWKSEQIQRTANDLWA